MTAYSDYPNFAADFLQETNQHGINVKHYIIMKSYLKSELAYMAGVSEPTFRRWLRRHDETLLRMGVSKTTKLLPPIAVEWICREYGIDIGS